MAYQIDQSIKIENTNKPSYVCLSNGRIVLVSISAKEKQKLKLFFRKIERPLIFKIFTFSSLCARAIKEGKVSSVSIDKEYLGHERDIKSFITQIFSIWGIVLPVINFRLIGKNSRAHINTYKAYKKKERGTVISSEDVLILYNLINKR